MTKHKSSLGIKYPTNRDHFLRCSESWLDGKRADDGAENLWRVYDELYDLNDFIKLHPGGRQWLEETRGTDITEAFETHHLKGMAEKILPKYFERKARTARNYPWTFRADGFYKTLKKNVQDELVNVPKASNLRSKIITDSLFLFYIVTALGAAFWRSWILGAFSGVLLALTANASHNFFHQRDNFRMYYFDFTFMFSRDWRITHAMSHHLYTNTISDIEVTALEPFYQYLPEEKSVFKYLQWLVTPFVYTFAYYVYSLNSMFYSFWYKKTLRWQIMLPLSVLVLMSSLPGVNVKNSIIMFFWIVTTSSFYFTLIGVNAAHHHPKLFHDGDAPRPEEEMDFGLYQLDAVADKTEITGNLFLVLTNFGDHALHHLFPTIDHAKLPYLYPIFLRTCEQFGVEWKLYNQLELTKGQFMQLIRDKNKVPPKPTKLVKKEM